MTDVNSLNTETRVKAEIREEIEEWCVHNAKTIYHNNGHREYVDVRDLLSFLNSK